MKNILILEKKVTMEKKTYKTPCMKVREISAHVMLNTSGGEKTMSKFSDEDLKGLGEDYSQW